MKKLIISLFAFLFILNVFGFASAEDIWGDAIEAELTIDIGMWCPIPDGKNWIDTTNNIFYNTWGDSVYDCRKMDGTNWVLPGNACCPENSDCQLSSDPNVYFIPGTTAGDKWRCVPTDKKVCGDYTDENSCKNSATNSIAEFSIESQAGKGDNYCNKVTSWSAGCTAIRSCNCVWNTTASKCTAQEKPTNITCTSTPSTINSCQYAVVYDDTACAENGGMITMTYTRVSGTVDDCPDGSNQISCESATRLSFFGVVSFVLAIIAIAIIYYLYFKKHNKKSKDKKKIKKNKKR